MTAVNDDKVSTIITEVPVPELKSGEILVKINWSGLCYNDVGPMRNFWPGSPRAETFAQAAHNISGHEGVGNVVAIADDVALENLWNLGDRVGIKWVASVCRKCEFCTNGRDEVNCQQPVYSGLTTPGTFQQYVATDARFALRLPDDVSDEEAAPLLCSGLTVYTATKRSKVQPGQWIVYLGGGGGQGHVGSELCTSDFPILDLLTISYSLVSSMQRLWECGPLPLMSIRRRVAFASPWVPRCTLIHLYAAISRQRLKHSLDTEVCSPQENDWTDQKR